MKSENSGLKDKKFSLFDLLIKSWIRALFVMFNKSMKFISRLNRENFFQILWLIMGVEVMKKCKHWDMGCEYQYNVFVRPCSKVFDHAYNTM